MQEIHHEQTGNRGSFFIEAGGRRLAELAYFAPRYQPITIEHTEVSDELRGTGAGARLVEAAVQFARAEGKKINPLCPFAKSVFDKTPAYRDVLA